jgi:hypothetical protein
LKGLLRSLYSSTTATQIFGGTLADGASTTHYMCIPKGLSVFFFDSDGQNPNEISYSICGYTGTVDEIVFIEVRVTVDSNATSVLPLNVAAIDKCDLTSCYD